MNITNNIAKFFAVAVVALVAFGMTFSFASALTKAELDSYIAQGFTAEWIMANVGGGNSSSSMSSCMTYGLPGTTGIQQAVNALGYSPALTVDGAYGPKTSAGVMWAQTKVGATADGKWGPLTQARYETYVAANCSMDNGNDDDDDSSNGSSGLSGGAGTITTDDLSDFQSEEVGEGSEAGVLAFEVEPDGSDIEITSIKVDFYQSATSVEQDLPDYADRVFVVYNGDEVGSADAEDFSENSDYWSKSISVDDLVIEEGDEATIEIWVEALNNLDSTDIASDAWTADVVNVRFVDADGVYTTESTGTAGSTGDALEQSFDFASFSSSSDLELKISKGDDSINDAHAIDIHATDETDKVELLSADFEVEGDSDVYIKDLSVTFTATGVNLEDAVTTVYLYADGEKVGSEAITKNTSTPGTTETIEFDEINYTIRAGDEVEFVVMADLESIADGIAAGDTIQAAIGATERALIDAEDESGEDVATGDMTGTASGDAHAMYDKGISVVFVGSSYTKSTSDTTGINETVEFTLEFDVKAFGDDMWISNLCADDSTPLSTYVTQTIVSLDGDTNGDNTTCTDIDGPNEGTNGFEIKEGATETITVTVLGNGGEAGGAGSSVTFTARVETIAYNVGTDAVGDTQYALNMTDYKSGAVTVFDR